MKGIVTEIQRFSIHDGPGIRTTVFLKGCNMRCAWCHNPETLAFSPQLQVFLDKCIGCGVCFRICPNNVHEMIEGKRVLHRERCTSCGACTEQCYAEALMMAGRETTVDEVLEEVLSDRDFYTHSGGGITLSGGEPACQAAFAYALLQRSKEEKIHTSIETNLSMPWQNYEALLPVTDLIMADIKTMNESLHKEWTGISNLTILENIRNISHHTTPIIIRTPIIPGINDTPEEISAIAAFLAGIHHLQYYELMPYHPLGTGKYESLGMPYRLPDVKAPASEHLKDLADIARMHGIMVKPE